MYEELIEPTRVLMKKGISKVPSNDEEVVLKIFGQNVLNAILKLKHDFFKTDAYKLYNDKPNWDLIYQKAKYDFKTKHPTCCDELIELFWWAYSFLLWKDGGISDTGIVM